MALPATIQAPSYFDEWRATWNAAEKSNGQRLVTDVAAVSALGTAYAPDLSNGEAVAIVTGWARAAARSTVRFPDAYGLTILGLGWRKPGDRFVMTQAHAKAAFPWPWAVWLATRELASALDTAGTVIRPIYLNPGMATVEEAARDAWTTMKARGDDKPQDPGTPCTPIPGTPICLPHKRPETPAIPPGLPISPPTPSKGFPWWLLLVAGGVGLYALGRSGR